ncbi:MAG: hypothetical protein AAFY01_02770 [Pseudomonadota bacterium]
MPAFPFGSDFTETEQRLIPALGQMREASASPLAALRLALLGRGKGTPDEDKAVARMKLDAPKDMRQRLYAALLRGALRKTAAA